MCGRLDKGKAVTAVAHKLARLLYAMLTKGTAYVDQGQAYYEERYQQRVIYHLRRKAAAMVSNSSQSGHKDNPLEKQPIKSCT